MGSRTHSAALSERKTTSAPSAVKCASIARTSIAPPRGTAASPGSTLTAGVGGVAAIAIDQGAKSTRAMSRTPAGPNASSSTAAATAPAKRRPARCSRGRSMRRSDASGRRSRTTCSTTRAVSAGEA